jgi:predicted Kef-type K+ transport protein
VLVVVISIGCVPVPVVCVVHMVAVRDRLVPAVTAMYVAVAPVREMRERMLIVVAIVRCVGMPFVHVVGVSFALGACVAAARSVLMVVVVSVMLGGCHVSSLLC